MWPTKKLRIMGQLSLIKQHAVLFLAWLPYSQGVLNPEGDSELVKEAEAPDTPPSQGVPRTYRGIPLCVHHLVCAVPRMTTGMILRVMGATS